MIVVDASVAAKWFVVEDGYEAAHAILQSRDPLIGPDFLIYETLNVLRRKHKKGELTNIQLQEAGGALLGFLDRLIPAAKLVDRTIELAQRLDHPVYDCAYLACAVEHGSVLVTADTRFLRKAVSSGFHANIVSL